MYLCLVQHIYFSLDAVFFIIYTLDKECINVWMWILLRDLYVLTFLYEHTLKGNPLQMSEGDICKRSYKMESWKAHTYKTYMNVLAVMNNFFINLLKCWLIKMRVTA